MSRLTVHPAARRGRSSSVLTTWTVAVLAGVVLCTAGCNPFRRSGEAELCKQDEVLAKAQSVPPLRVPPGLESPDTSRALRIPELNTPPPPPRKVSEGCLDEPPRYMTQKPSEPQA
jgi:hypothetical protein